MKFGHTWEERDLNRNGKERNQGNGEKFTSFYHLNILENI